MKRILMAVGLLLAISPIAWAQAPANSGNTGPVTGMKPDRTTAPLAVRENMKAKEAAKRKGRAECRAKAKAEKIPLIKRAAYVKKCRAEAN